jgi:hypothetical protein
LYNSRPGKSLLAKLRILISYQIIAYCIETSSPRTAARISAVQATKWSELRAPSPRSLFHFSSMAELNDPRYSVMGSPEKTEGHANEKSSDVDSHSNVQASDPTTDAPWRWRIIAMLFALSLAGKLF